MVFCMVLSPGCVRSRLTMCTVVATRFPILNTILCHVLSRCSPSHYTNNKFVCEVVVGVGCMGVHKLAA